MLYNQMQKTENKESAAQCQLRIKMAGQDKFVVTTDLDTTA